MLKEAPKKIIHERLNESCREILQTAYDCNEMLELAAIMRRAEDEIRALAKDPNKLQIADIYHIHSRINLIVEDMFIALSEFIQNFVCQTYERTYNRLMEVFHQILGNTKFSPIDLTVKTQIFDKICPWFNSWLEKQKKATA